MNTKPRESGATGSADAGGTAARGKLAGGVPAGGAEAGAAMVGGPDAPSPSGSSCASSAPVTARSVLVELADLLEAERAALISLDREAISSFATRKLELDQELTRAAQQHALGASELALLERVRQSALSNQLLLAHARSCVQGVLSLLTPVNTPRYTAPGHSPAAAHSSPEAPPVALNLRR